MNKISIKAGSFTFSARLEESAAPKTCSWFQKLLPYEQTIIHVRWSGEAVWIPLGELDVGLSLENSTSYPAPGQIIIYPGGASETEFLLAYGAVRFSSKVGQLAGNHFATITDPLGKVAELGRTTLWQGAQPIRFESA